MSNPMRNLRLVSGCVLLQLAFGSVAHAQQPTPSKPPGPGAAPAASAAPVNGNPTPAPVAAPAQPPKAEPAAPASGAAPKAVSDAAAAAAPAASTPPAAANVGTTATAAPGVEASAVKPDAASQQQTAASGANPEAANAAATPAEPPGPLAPLNPFIRLYLSVDSVWNKDPGYDYFSSDDVGQRIGVLADFDVLNLGSDLVLALEGGISGEFSDDGAALPGLVESAGLGSTHLLGGVVGRYAWFEHVEFHARLAGGVSFNEARIEMPEALVKADSISPFVGIGGGLSLVTSARRLDNSRKRFNSVAFGGRFEGGYMLSSRLEMAFPNRDVDLPEQRLRVQGANLGAIERDGAFFDVAGFVYF